MNASNIMPIEKTYAGYISVMSQGFKTNSKLTISNPRDRFLRHSKCIEVAIGSTITDISIVIFARLYMKKTSSLSMDRVQD